MIASTWIVAGTALVIGVVAGFVFGQAYANMCYEERLRSGAVNRASLANQLTNMRFFLRTGGLESPPASRPASAHKKEGE